MAGTERPGRKFVMRLSALAVSAAALATALTAQARAQIGSDRYSSIVVDAATGNVLEAANPDAPRRPASLAKLMTLYMVFEALRDRRITTDELVPVSAHAAATAPTKLGLMPGTRLTVEEAILGLVTKSANDAAAALGELLGGSEDRFAQMMTLRARALGMSRTTFTNASGLPDPDQWTTARDLAILARHLLTDFPGYYPYFSTPSFTFRRRVIFNHDRMLQSYPGADGMKTGYTEASGHNLVTSAVHSGVRLIGVVLGAGSNPERDAHMATLLDQGFEQMDVPPERRTRWRAGCPAWSAPRMPRRWRCSRFARNTRAHAPPGPSRSAASATRGLRAKRHPLPAGRPTAARFACETASQHGRTVWRAQVTGLTAAEAQGACAALARRRGACMVLRPDQRQVASR